MNDQPLRAQRMYIRYPRQTRYLLTPITFISIDESHRASLCSSALTFPDTIARTPPTTGVGLFVCCTGRGKVRDEMDCGLVRAREREELSRKAPNKYRLPARCLSCVTVEIPRRDCIPAYPSMYDSIVVPPPRSGRGQSVQGYKIIMGRAGTVLFLSTLSFLTAHCFLPPSVLPNRSSFRTNASGASSITTMVGRPSSGARSTADVCRGDVPTPGWIRLAQRNLARVRVGDPVPDACIR